MEIPRFIPALLMIMLILTEIYALSMKAHQMVQKTRCILGRPSYVKDAARPIEVGHVSQDLGMVRAARNGSESKHAHGSLLMIYGSALSVFSGVLWMTDICESAYRYVVWGEKPLNLRIYRREVIHYRSKVVAYNGVASALQANTQLQLETTKSAFGRSLLGFVGFDNATKVSREKGHYTWSLAESASKWKSRPRNY